MLPAPGVEMPPTTDGVMNALAWTTPLNVVFAALTVTPSAVIVSVAELRIVIAEVAAIVMPRGRP